MQLGFTRSKITDFFEKESGRPPLRVCDASLRRHDLRQPGGLDKTRHRHWMARGASMREGFCDMGDSTSTGLFVRSCKEFDM